MNALLNRREVDLIALSGIYETAPVGGPEQGLYLNAVALLSTALAPAEFLSLIFEAEKKAGRDRSIDTRWGPRLLDIDLLAHGMTTCSGPDLVLPHPRLYEREFVLVPLFEVGLIEGTSIDFDRAESALRALRGTQGVERVEAPGWL